MLSSFDHIYLLGHLCILIRPFFCLLWATCRLLGLFCLLGS
ncbi:unnamed protein product [Arabidopsis halleri]